MPNWFESEDKSTTSIRIMLIKNVFFLSRKEYILDFHCHIVSSSPLHIHGIIFHSSIGNYLFLKWMAASLLSCSFWLCSKYLIHCQKENKLPEHFISWKPFKETKKNGYAGNIIVIDVEMEKAGTPFLSLFIYGLNSSVVCNSPQLMWE